jgi:hypothetical protein
MIWGLLSGVSISQTMQQANSGGFDVYTHTLFGQILIALKYGIQHSLMVSNQLR